MSKKYAHLISVVICGFFSLPHFLLAQCPPNGITTNPDNTDWSSPVYNQPYKKNTGTNLFDWRQEYFNVSISSFPLARVTSPYYFDGTATGLTGIAQGDSNPAKYDFYPEDGWELIRKDFGLKADGTVITNEAVLGPYYILYNKFSSTLRVIGWTGSSVGYFPTINVKISLINDSQSDNASGLFSYYNQIASPLDQPSSTTYATTPAALTGDVSVPFFADFKVAYDPCTCLFNSNLRVDFEKVQSMNIQLYGRVLATSTPIDLVSSDNSLQYENFLTSVYNLNQSSNYKVTAGMLTYRDINSMLDDYNSSADASSIGTTLKNGLDIFGKALTSGGDLKALTKIKDGLEAASNLSDFFSSLISSDATSLPSVIQGEMALTGQIINSSDQHTTIPLANPGSLNSSNAIECCSSTGPFYPMYNEVLGTFALLNTPTAIDRYMAGARGPVGHQIQLTSAFNYVFNPAVNVNLAKSKVYAAFEVETPGPILATPGNLFLRYYNVLDGNDNTTHTLYSSPVVPIESLKDLIIGFGLGWSASISTTYKARISIMLDLEYADLNRNGMPNHSFTVLTYPLNVTSVYTSSFVKSTNFQEFVTVPTSYFSSNQTISAWKDITVSGALTTTNGASAVLLAGGEAVLTSGNSIGVNVSMQAGISPMPLNTSLNPQSSTAVSSFCTSGSYKAKVVATSASRDGATEFARKNDSKEKLLESTAYPNPSQGKISFHYYLEEGSYMTLSIQDLNGKTLAVVVDGFQEAGVYDLPYETNLSNGVYIYVLETNKGKQTKRLVIAK